MDEDEIVRRVGELAKTDALPAPASSEVVDEVERRIGFQLPRLLKRLYLEAANGGFGPDDGVLGLPGGEWNGDWSDILHIHEAIQSDPDEDVPPYFIWAYEWGCGIWSLIDSREPSGPMWAWDPNDGLENALFSLDMNFKDWMSRALAGELELPERGE
ncbi:SMI1/KNR4 family protein [Streptomyces sp. NPDC058287]|uniref:SMI1/KNR4 family protein n=1 Tax=unclassified Streptomyces TaxID=2593676 RepID=UPI0036E74EA4